MVKNKKTSRKVVTRRKKSSGGFLMIRIRGKRSKLLTLGFVVLFAAIGAALLFKSFAAVSYNTFDEAIQLHDINKTRSGLGLNSLVPTSCIQQVARDWSVAMATTLGPKDPPRDMTLVHFRHNPNSVAQIVSKCNVAGKWSWEAENIAESSGCPAGDTSPNNCSQSLYNALTSPTEVYNCVSKVDTSDHYCNITSNLAQYVGVGAYRDSKGLLWITEDFLRCVGCGLPKQFITYWNLEGGVTASSPGVARAQNINVKRGEPITWYHDVKNNGPIAASFDEHEDYYHFNKAGTLLTTGTYFSTRTPSIPWDQVYLHVWDKSSVPSSAPIGDKYCHRVWYDDATGPNTGGEARPKPPDYSCVTVVS